jgi:hypothetical protein
MSQSLSKIWTHLVFSTKDRFPFLSDKTVRHEMHAYLAKILKANNCPTLLVGGVSIMYICFLSCQRTIRSPALFGRSNAPPRSGQRVKARCLESFTGKMVMTPSR